MSFLNIKSVLASVCAMALASNLMAAGPSTKKGDSNQDGKIDNADAILIAKHIIGEELLQDQALLNADYNNDGKINIVDIIQTLKNGSQQLEQGSDEAEHPSIADAPIRRDNNE